MAGVGEDEEPGVGQGLVDGERVVQADQVVVAGHHQHRLVDHLTPLDPAYRQSLTGAAQLLVGRGASPPDAAAQAHGLIYGTMLRQAGMQSFLDAFWIMGVLFLAVLPLVFLMRKTRPPSGPLMIE